MPYDESEHSPRIKELEEALIEIKNLVINYEGDPFDCIGATIQEVIREK